MDSTKKSPSIVPAKELWLYASCLKKQNMNDVQIFQNVLQEFNGTPYVWGGSSIEKSDCSGSVCATLNALYARSIRVTADELFRRYFTKGFCGKEDHIHAVFFLNKEYTAVHVAGYIGNRFYMNVSSIEPNFCGTVRTYEQLRYMYPDYLMVRRNFKGIW